MKVENFKEGLCSFLLLSTILVAGCTKKETTTTPAPPVATTPSPMTAPPAPAPPSADAGTIKGKATFQGGLPSMKTVSMAKESACAMQTKTKPQHQETVVVNPNKTLRYVVVYIDKGAPESTASLPPVKMDQKVCWYRPHVVGVKVGQTLNVTNSDSGVLHNIHFMPKLNTPFNFSQPGPAPGAPPPVRTVVFLKSEMIPVKCDVHAWMHAIVAVLPSSYFGVTDETGSFEIRNVPPGNYTLEAWHEKYGTQKMDVKVGPKETKTVSFTFK